MAYSARLPDFSVDLAHVRSWLDSLPDNPHQGIEEFTEEPPFKRRRITAEEGVNMGSLPNSPPLSHTISLAARPAALDPSRKRGRDSNRDLNLDPSNIEVNSTPQQTTARTQFLPLPIYPPPIKKQKAANPTLQRLEILEKPLHVSSSPKTVDELPKDVQNLYTRLQEIENNIQIIPHEAREQLEARGVKVFPHFFRKENTDDGLQIDDLFKIVQNATDSTLFHRHECGWNQHVHGPLLKLVFASKISDFFKKDPTEGPTVQARFEPVMSATIHGTWIPQYRSAGSQGPIRLPCDVSRDSPSGSTQSGLTENVTLSGVHSSSGSKKVDYVIVLDENGLLEKAIASRTFLDASLRNQSPHVNQTLYPAITKSPIAVSIETKKLNAGADQDPLVQLGIWVAAWHSRLVALRYTERVADPARLVTLPLIEITGHVWMMWLACDMVESIGFRGPIKLGETRTIVSLYALLRSLQALREWIKTEFYAAMKAWFMPDVESNDI
ncbi:hypothetical protein F5Y07DRAFT_346259 [Xylaria sp. FL0933]|nr:hypothetical protein F5Y07DRAFT_346259 [Xylaria sp. FL0933]